VSGIGRAPPRAWQTRLLGLEFTVASATGIARHPQRFFARQRRQIRQGTATERTGELAVEPQIPALTKPCARTDQRMIAPCDEQIRRRLDFVGDKTGVLLRPLDPSFLLTEVMGAIIFEAQAELPAPVPEWLREAIAKSLRKIRQSLLLGD
jgi:hypothetical protein